MKGKADKRSKKTSFIPPEKVLSRFGGAIAKVFRLRPSTLNVIQNIYSRCSSDSYSWPSRARVANDCAIGETSVKTAFRQLQNACWDFDPLMTLKFTNGQHRSALKFFPGLDKLLLEMGKQPDHLCVEWLDAEGMTRARPKSDSSAPLRGYRLALPSPNGVPNAAHAGVPNATPVGVSDDTLPMEVSNVPPKVEGPQVPNVTPKLEYQKVRNRRPRELPSTINSENSSAVINAHE